MEEMIDKAKLVTTRDGTSDDTNFILATWLRGLYYGDSWFSLIPKDTFMTHYHEILEKLLTWAPIRIKVACLKDDPEVILGYSVLSGDQILHWVHVKKAWRGIGIAKDLMPSTIEQTTHLNKAGVSLLKKFPQVSFNPFKLQ